MGSSSKFQTIGVAFDATQTTFGAGGVVLDASFGAFYEASFRNCVAYASIGTMAAALELTSSSRAFLGR